MSREVLPSVNEKALAHLGRRAIKRILRLIFNEKLQTLTISGAATFYIQRVVYLMLFNVIAISYTCSLVFVPLMIARLSRNMSEIL